jgi:transcriptional regulator with XRE-family HTH domain
VPVYISAALSGARVAAGLTQEELAERSGLSVRAIRNLETGRTGQPRRQSIGLLAEALGLLPAQLVSARAVPVRSELPACFPAPVGRSSLLADLCEVLADAPGQQRQRLAVVTGPPGSGKTATVTHAARLLGDHYPDQQSYLDLEARAGVPMTAAAVAARVVHSFGSERPLRSPEEAIARARASLAGHRAIIVLDNVVSEAQVRPLLCAVPHSAVLVAARRTLPALPAAAQVQLGALAPDAAGMLLSRIAGPERTTAEPAAAARITRSCGGLPLALQIAGLRLADRPHWRLADLADRLADERDRLNFLRIGDLSLRASVAAAYRSLTATQRAAVGKLRGLRGFFEISQAVSLLRWPERVTVDLVDGLVQCQVIDRGQPCAGSSPRYRMHDSFRLYAARPW